MILHLRNLIGIFWSKFTIGSITVILLLLKIGRSRNLKNGKLLYVTASAYPYHISGYTRRTQEVVTAFRSIGLSVEVLTRPGYPWDRKDRLCEAATSCTDVDGVVYNHIKSPTINTLLIFYALLGAYRITKFAKKSNAVVIHAASNHFSALPALLAARMMGIKFNYEMRGLWELTRITRHPNFEKSYRFESGLNLERLVARSSDNLYVISERLGGYIHFNWGIKLSNIKILPNCVSQYAITKEDSASVYSNSIGYAGSLIGYEGLDLLIKAIALLAKEGLKITLTIVGDGESRIDLENLAKELGLVDQIQFFGKKSPEVSKKLLSNCSVICIPRRNYEVCRLITPIKLVEALALGKPVVVPDLPVFRDELAASDGFDFGFFFEAGSVNDLSRALKEAFNPQSDLNLMGDMAKEYVLKHRLWTPFVKQVALNVRGCI